MRSTSRGATGKLPEREAQRRQQRERAQACGEDGRQSGARDEHGEGRGANGRISLDCTDAPSMRRTFLALLFVPLFALATPAFAADGVLRLATTTSTENSGLLKAIMPKFEEASGLKVQVISVGTGKAMKLGENGDVDVVLVHSRPDEDHFVAQGFGVNRRDVMYNDFVVVGPKADPRPAFAE